MKNSTEKQVIKKIGIMGGTFNPVHVGHLMLAEWAKDAVGLDQILFIPAGNPYMKSGSNVLDGNKRLEMVFLAIKDNPAFTASGMEINRDGYTYTCDTIEQLKREDPSAEYYFIMGADCLYTIEKWREPERIFNSCHVIAAARGCSSLADMEEKRRQLIAKYHGSILLLQFPDIDISSTDIRERISAGQSIRYLVPESIRNYIMENGLYQK